MARGVNKVILVGALGGDPETRYTSNGAAITNLSLATSESWKDRNTGQMQEKTEWHRIVIFGKLAEIAQQYLRKGSKVYIEGKLQTRKWQDQQGNDRYTTEVVLDFNGQMQMLDSRNSMDQSGGNYQQPQQAAYSQPAQSTPQAPAANPMSSNNNHVGGGAAPMPSHSSPQQPAQPPQQPAQSPSQQPPGFDDFDDDIPF